MAWFLKDPMLLEDRYDVLDLFDNEITQNDIWKKIQWLPNKSILALVWAYWCGKSTCIHNIKINNSGEAPKPFWIHFDAWKYPDRREMWEWFILDLADQIWKWRHETAREIDGENMTVADWIFTTISAIPWLWAADKIAKIFESKWAKRIFDLQEILKKIITNFDRNLVIVIEDIDRSWEYWCLFLETLSYFIKNNFFWEKNIKIVVLIWDKSYKDFLESYLKSIDTFEFFTPKYKKFEKFILNIIDESFIPSWTLILGQLSSFLFELFKLNISIRKIKSILKKADLIYRRQKDDGHNPNFLINICIETLRFWYSWDDNLSDYDRNIKEWKIRMDTIPWKFIKMLCLRVPDFQTFFKYRAEPAATSYMDIWTGWDSDYIVETFYFDY
ncbi:MAG: hypothetical protein ACD_3C00128G0001 [uncultured bacterium (gcode 4)]|uniref:KAP NTPase domain-containing protein n=1 Tax=uncultured bacterium (gcode 4) TaxID=1234023 RepID=K2GX21_9BACT|nr:MAG: hypothetical protein ACD_3C00128G0001 [uncultured bacterium (gcode 4)]